MKNGERGWLGFGVICLFLTLLFSTAKAIVYNEPAPEILRAASLQQESLSLDFDPNDYSFLIYDCGSGEIQTAMNVMGIPYTLRNKSNPVTLEDLSEYDILIVGWKAYSSDDTDGLDPEIIKQGITGRVILTGHDTEWHTAANRSEQPYAERFLSQCIGYILAGGSTGLLAHGEPVDGFDWLPDSWGIEVTDGLALETITGFTQDGIDSGIFDGLTKENMSNWRNSFHNTFTSYGMGFEAFEMGWVNDANSIITIAAQYSPIGLTLTKEDDVSDGDCRSPSQTIVYTINWSNQTSQTFTDVSIVDTLPAGVDFDDFVSGTLYQSVPAPADPNIVFALTDNEGLSDITLPIGQSITIYLTKETTSANIYSFALEANISDPNLGWIDNTEYDPNDPNLATAEILAAPRTPDYDYYGPGYANPQGIQFSAVSFGNVMQDGDLASFVYTATQPGYVVLTLVNYDENSATLEEIVIRQTDPNDPNYIPQEPNEPQGSPPSASSVEGYYDEENHKVIWELGDVVPSDSGSVSFRVIVNYKSEPGISLHNIAEAYTGQTLITRASVDTLVCCWDTTDPNIIFVDKTATGNNNGTSWSDAYKDLQDALYRAENTACENVNTIFVAQGEYNPGTGVLDNYVIPDGIFAYGGFKSGGCAFEYRNPKVYVTTLTGLIDSTTHNEIVVKMGDETLLSGFTIRDSSASPAGYGVYGTGVDFTILNCSIENNLQYGLYIENCNVTLKWCQVEDNGYNGIHQIGNDNSILVENCQINNNHRYGLLIENSFSIIKNSVICRNGVSDSEYYGIYISSPSDIPQIYNNTVAYNYNAAIAYTDDDPNYVNTPDIQNCIIWYNNEQGDGEQFVGRKPNRHYSCIYDPNYPGGMNETIDSNHNFSHKPDFAYPYSADPNVLINIHLAPDSFCKEKGNPNLSYADQNDIDAEYRVADNYVDVGADEISCSVVYNAFDWNADGIVNYGEINKYSQNWLAHDPNDPALLDPNDPMYDEYHDPNSPYYISPESQEQWHSEGYQWNFVSTNDSMYSIDVADLMVLVEDSPWLWIACWRHDIQDYLSQGFASSQQMMALSSSTEFSDMAESVETLSLSSEMSISDIKEMQAVETTAVSEPVEVFDPVAESEQISSLLKDIEVFIDAGGDDADTWKEIKILLEQSLADIEDMTNEPTEI